MDDHLIIEKLIHFGLTRQEASIYTTLVKYNELTGYEISKKTGISRSNAYSCLGSLVDKGAAYLIESDVTRYTAVDIDEFCSNKIRKLTLEHKYLVENMPKTLVIEEGYITIKTDEHILNKIHNIFEQAEKRVYVSMSDVYLDLIMDDLKALADRGIQINIITNKEVAFDGAKVYISEDANNQIGIITDSVKVLTGEYGLGSDSTCLYSGQRNFVRVFKDSLSNEIKLIQMNKGDNNIE